MATQSPAPYRPRTYLWLLVLPFVWQIGGTPLANGIDWHPLGLPFLMVWQMAGVVFSSVVFAWVFHLDKLNGVHAADEAALENSAEPAARGGH